MKKCPLDMAWGVFRFPTGQLVDAVGFAFPLADGVGLGDPGTAAVTVNRWAQIELQCKCWEV